jgi:hypothetical protein
VEATNRCASVRPFVTLSGASIVFTVLHKPVYLAPNQHTASNNSSAVAAWGPSFPVRHARGGEGPSFLR